MIAFDSIHNALTQTPELSLIQVFPSADVLPENLLRFHLRFSQSPEVFDVTEHLRLIDTSNTTNQIVCHPFLDLNDGLWSADGLTLTVMLHPARIKSGTFSHAKLGMAIGDTRSYQLQVQGGFEANEFVSGKGTWLTLKRFSVTHAINSSIDISSLVVDLPRIETRTVMSIKIRRIVDQLAIENLITMTDEHSAIVPIEFATSDSGTTILLTPKIVWIAGTYLIHFSSEFEDVCGNRFGVSFENEAASQLDVPTAHLVVQL